ncbi:hypothetical protein AB0N07_05690 [Streptomyces sp. NPDC051172]|uniref:hypothetical protein n=1 Tax=Streptomyces sp. NPDC051172 TaxID=3155796 RepID=UPI0034484910
MAAEPLAGGPGLDPGQGDRAGTEGLRDVGQQRGATDPNRGTAPASWAAAVTEAAVRVRAPGSRARRVLALAECVRMAEHLGGRDGRRPSRAVSSR